jgi:hypothetical protein
MAKKMDDDVPSFRAQRGMTGAVAHTYIPKLIPPTYS